MNIVQWHLDQAKKYLERGLLSKAEASNIKAFGLANKYGWKDERLKRQFVVIHNRIAKRKEVRV